MYRPLIFCIAMLVWDTFAGHASIAQEPMLIEKRSWEGTDYIVAESSKCDFTVYLHFRTDISPRPKFPPHLKFTHSCRDVAEKERLGYGLLTYLGEETKILDHAVWFNWPGLMRDEQERMVRYWLTHHYSDDLKSSPRLWGAGVVKLLRDSDAFAKSRALFKKYGVCLKIIDVSEKQYARPFQWLVETGILTPPLDDIPNSGVLYIPNDSPYIIFDRVAC